MFDLSMFPEPVVTAPVTRVTEKNTTQLHTKPNKNNAVTGVTGKIATRLQENSLKNNVVTRVTRVTGKNQYNRKRVTNQNDAELREMFEERAAIMEFEGGLPRAVAESQARVICLEEFRNRRNGSK